MLRYFPITEPGFHLKMDTRAYDGPLIEIELDLYRSQVTERREIIASDPDYYHACPYGAATEAAWGAMVLVLRDMARRFPDWFKLQEEDGGALLWQNRLLGEKARLVSGDMSTIPGGYRSPLDWLGGQVQEDLILMQAGQESSEGGDEAICVAGHLCFASGWSLRGKLGKSMLGIHGEVPVFATAVGQPSKLLMQRLKPRRTVMRFNWTTAESADLNCDPRLRDRWAPNGARITPENAGRLCYLRVEKQTLTRLPVTGAILFTIHTFVNPIEEVCADGERRGLLAGALRSLPPEMVAYRSAGAYIDSLRAYVDSIAEDG